MPAAGKHVYRRGIDVEFAGEHDHPCRCRAGRRRRHAEIDGRGLMVMPGLIDIHAHPSSEPMLKGLTDEVGSPKLYKARSTNTCSCSRTTPRARGRRARSRFCELLTSGVTTLCDLSLEHDGWLDTLGESGMRVYAAPMFRSGRWRTGERP